MVTSSNLLPLESLQSKCVTVVHGKFMDDVRKQLGALHTTVQDQQEKIEELKKEVRRNQCYRETYKTFDINLL